MNKVIESIEVIALSIKEEIRRVKKASNIFIFILILFLSLYLFIIYWFLQENQKIKYEYNYEILCTRDFYDCKDFSTKDVAQMILAYCLWETHGIDIHNLDKNQNGWACEEWDF